MTVDHQNKKPKTKQHNDNNTTPSET